MTTHGGTSQQKLSIQLDQLEPVISTGSASAQQLNPSPMAALAAFSSQGKTNNEMGGGAQSSTTGAIETNQQKDSKKPKGEPDHVGISSFEYTVDERLHFSCEELTQLDAQENYLTQMAPNDNSAEHQLSNYLKSIVKQEEGPNKGANKFNAPPVTLQNGQLELNTCGVSRQIKVCFLFNKAGFSSGSSNNNAKNTGNVANSKDNGDSKQLLNLAQRSQMVTASMRDRSAPHLDGLGGSEEAVDELDNEVAQISSTKQENAAMLNHDDIKLEFNNKNSRRHLHDEEWQINQEIYLMNEGEEDWFCKLLTKCISSVKVYGFNCNSIPAITNLTYLMNQNFLLLNHEQQTDADEVNFLVGVLMISTKRHTQAQEVFRRIQTNYFKRIQQGMQSLGDLKQQRQINEKDLNTLKLKVQNLYTKSAILELLVAESMCATNQVIEKMIALDRMCKLSTGHLVDPIKFSPQIPLADDSFTQMLRILPSILRFCLLCVSNSIEIVKVSALKVIEFVLETQGCSLDFAMVYILKAIFQSKEQNGNNGEGQESRLSYRNNANVQHDAPPPSENTSALKNHVKVFKTGEIGQIINDNASSHSHLFTNQKELKVNNSAFYHEVPYQQSTFTKSHEPSSGFQTALNSLVNHVLDSFISVLSSISSHILHSIFYEVIEPCLVARSATSVVLGAAGSSDIKTAAVKIAEKIITICQGDLLMSKPLLDELLRVCCSTSPAAQLGGEQVISAIKNLWASIRSKVFTNYSIKGFQLLIEWLMERMTSLAQRVGAGAMQQSMIELNDEDMGQIQQICDVITLVSVGRNKKEEEANSLIKIKQDFCSELYLLLNPLLFWLEISIEREDRFHLFQQLYQTVKDVLDSLPPGKVDLNVLQITIPTLERTTEFLRNNSPSLSMLKFLDIVLLDILQGNYCQKNSDLQYFFLEMLNNFVNYISYNLYEEVFSVFDKLLQLCQDVMNEQVLKKCIIALVDKYTLKTKSHKNSIQIFMKSLMEVKVRNHSKEKSRRAQLEMGSDFELNELEDQISIHSKNNYFEIMVEFCFFGNEDLSSKLSATNSAEKQRNLKLLSEPQLEFKGASDLHDLYIDKMQFFIDSLSLMNEYHISMFTNLITHPRFKPLLVNLIEQGETQLRLKSHEILEILTNYFVQYCPSKTVYEFSMPPENMAANGLDLTRKQKNEVMDVEFVSHERLYISQIVINICRTSLEKTQDSYLQFNSLILLDFLFQNLLTVPTFQNEQFKKHQSRKDKKKNQGEDDDELSEANEKFELENLSINETTPEFEVTEQSYLNMRLKLVFSLWPFIQSALNSSWSNIRSICYGLICSMLKIDISEYKDEQTIKIDEDEENGEGDIKEKDNNENNKDDFFTQLQEIVLPMLQSLLSSKESESKAGGLNILGSFCGLSYDFSKVKISKNTSFFQRNSEFISLPIWKLVYDLQDDWDITIKEASVVLIQLCAPRDAIRFYNKQKQELEQEKMNNMFTKIAKPQQQKQQSLGNLISHSNISSTSQLLLSGNFTDRQHDEILTTSRKNQLQQSGGCFNKFLEGASLSDLHSTEQFSNCKSKEQLLQEHSELTIQIEQFAAEEIVQRKKSRKQQLEIELDLLKSNKDDKNQAPKEPLIQPFDFFVDKYSDDQIQEIISIFRNDFKPPKNLWIEKSATSVFNSPDYYGEIYAQAIEQFNQQQMRLQAEQQEQLQQQVSTGQTSPALSSQSNRSSGTLIDQLEDEIIQKSENQHKKSQEDKENNLSQNSGSPSSQKLDSPQRDSSSHNSSKSPTDLMKNEESPTQTTSKINSQNQSDEKSPKNDNNIILSSSAYEFDASQSNTLNENNKRKSNDQGDQTAKNHKTSKDKADYDQVSKPAPKPANGKGSKDPQKSEEENQKLKQGLKIYEQLNFDEMYIQNEDVNTREFAFEQQRSQPSSNSSSQSQSRSNQSSSRDGQQLSRSSQDNSQQESSQNQSQASATESSSSADYEPVNMINQKQSKKNRKLGQESGKKRAQAAAANNAAIVVDEQQYNQYEIANNKMIENIMDQAKHKTQIQFYPQPRNQQLEDQQQQDERDNVQFESPDNEQQQQQYNYMGGGGSHGGQPRRTLQKKQSLHNSTPDLMKLNIPDHQLLAEYKQLNQQSQGGFNQSTGGLIPKDAVKVGASTKISRKQAQTYLSELSKGYIQNIDNMKLIQQINTTFNQDNSYENSNSVVVPHSSQVMSQQNNNSGQQNHVSVSKKKKLNKSYENLTATNNKLALKQQEKNGSKKVLLGNSTSPKRASGGGSGNNERKRGHSSKSAQNQKKKSNSGALDPSKTGNHKAMNNLRDLNYFIKTIEKDLNNKLSNGNQFNLKDFNSVPTTPTSILKKVEDQMKAIAQSSKLSSTCPNIQHQLMLNSLESAQQEQSQQKASIGGRVQPPQLKLATLNHMNQVMATDENNNQSATYTPSNISLGGGKSSRQMLNFNTTSPAKKLKNDNNLICMTQRLDLHDMKNIVAYQHMGSKTQTHREQMAAEQQRLRNRDSKSRDRSAENNPASSGVTGYSSNAFFTSAKPSKVYKNTTVNSSKTSNQTQPPKHPRNNQQQQFSSKGSTSSQGKSYTNCMIQQQQMSAQDKLNKLQHMVNNSNGATSSQRDKKASQIACKIVTNGSSKQRNNSNSVGETNNGGRSKSHERGAEKSSNNNDFKNSKSHNYGGSMTSRKKESGGSNGGGGQQDNKKRSLAR